MKMGLVFFADPMRLPRKPPSRALRISEVKETLGRCGKVSPRIKKCPTSPEIEFNKIKIAEIPEIFFTLPTFKNRRRGDKNIPPPTPMIPEIKPISMERGGNNQKVLKFLEVEMLKGKLIVTK
jgi:hypothetical protein